jgi:phytoene dehydrogenase-like protein
VQRWDVIVVGAGLAGLACARRLIGAGLDIALLEASDGVGGRLRTDHVDGLLLDRGFAVHNPSYPEAARVLDQKALDLRPFAPGLVVSLGNRHIRLADPLRRPRWVGHDVVAPIGSPLVKARFAAYAVQCAYANPRRIAARSDISADDAFRQAGLDGTLLERVLRPFLSGVLFDDRLTASRLFVDLVLRSFVRGTPALPAAGMGAIAEQLAAGLPADCLQLHSPVHSVSAGKVRTVNEEFTTRAVVVATDPAAAGSLLPEITVPRMRHGTTWYFLADTHPESPRGALLVDGQRRGPVTSTVVLTDIAPSYATDNRILVSASILGLRGASEDERIVRAHLAQLYGVDTHDWDTVAVYPIQGAVPAMEPPLQIRQPVRLAGGCYIAGDHRDTASIQGALVSGRRAANAVLKDLQQQ